MFKGGKARFYRNLLIVLSFCLFLCVGCTKKAEVHPEPKVVYKDYNSEFIESEKIKLLAESYGPKYELMHMELREGIYYFQVIDKAVSGVAEVYSYNINKDELKSIYKPDTISEKFSFTNIACDKKTGDLLFGYSAGDGEVQPYEIGIMKISNNKVEKLIYSHVWSFVDFPRLQEYGDEIYFFLPDVSPKSGNYMDAEYHFSLLKYENGKISMLDDPFVQLENYRYTESSGRIVFREGSAMQLRPIPCEKGVCYISCEKGIDYLYNTNKEIDKIKFKDKTLIYGYINGQYIIRQTKNPDNDQLFLFNSHTKEKTKMRWIPEKMYNVKPISKNTFIFADENYKLYSVKITENQHTYTKFKLPFKEYDSYLSDTDGDYITLTRNSRMFFIKTK